MTTVVIKDDEIKQLEEEILALKVKLSEKQGVLNYLLMKRTEAKTIVLSSDTKFEEVVLQDGVIDLSKLDVPSMYRRTLFDDIWAVVSKFGDQEFMVTTVEAVLKAQGTDVEGKSPRARIAGILSKMLEHGKLIQTLKGSGNVPHRYKLAKKSENVTTGHSDVLDL
jgi:hypothetical protein